MMKQRVFSRNFASAVWLVFLSHGRRKLKGKQDDDGVTAASDRLVMFPTLLDEQFLSYLDLFKMIDLLKHVPSSCPLNNNCLCYEIFECRIFELIRNVIHVLETSRYFFMMYSRTDLSQGLKTCQHNHFNQA